MSGIMARHGHAPICRVGFSFLTHFPAVLTTHTNTVTLIKKLDITLCGSWAARDAYFLLPAFPPASRVEVCFRRAFPTSSYAGIK